MKKSSKKINVKESLTSKSKASLSAVICSIIAVICIIILPELGIDISKLTENVDIYNVIEDSLLITPDEETNESDSTENVAKENQSHKTLDVYYIDVGQADSILIAYDYKYMLIDAGNNKDGDKLVKYLNGLGVKRLEYVIGTHPHEDHIGGLDNVIKSFDIGTIYMPKVSTNTKTFEDVLDAIKDKGLTVTSPNKGDKFSLEDLKFEVLSAENEATLSDLNYSSIVVKLTYNENTFLFTGDATNENEANMLKDRDVSADVLKVGHHGSATSSSNAFLDAVKPKYAIISVGKDNSYGHPTNEALGRLNERKIIIYRTDEKGTIHASCNGNEDSIKFEFLKTDTDGNK